MSTTPVTGAAATPATYADPDAKPVVTKTTGDDPPVEAGLTGDELTKGKGASSQKATVEVVSHATTFADKNEHPELYQKGGDGAAAVTDPPSEVAPVDQSNDEAADGQHDIEGLKLPGESPTLGLTADRYSLGQLKLDPHLGGTLDLHTPLSADLKLKTPKLDDPWKPRTKLPAITGFSGWGLNLDSYFKDSVSMMARLMQFQYAATSKVDKQDVYKLEDAFAQADTALKSFDYLATDKQVDKSSQAYKSYMALQTIIAKVKDPSFATLKEADKGALRKQLYDEISTFSKAMNNELKTFAADWAAGRGGDPAFRRFINEQFAAVAYQASMDDIQDGKPATPKKLTFSDANKDQWPPALTDAMASFGATTVKDLQKKLGLKQDGVFGPQVFLAIQLNGLRKVQRGLDSAAKEVRSDLYKTQAWATKVKALKASGLAATLQERPQILTILKAIPKPLPAGTDLKALKGDALMAKLEELTGMKLGKSQWEMYTALALYNQGYTASQGQLAHLDGSAISTAEFAALTADLVDSQAAKLEQRFNALDTKADDLDFTHKADKVTANLKRDIDELKMHPEKEPTTSGERTASVIGRVNADMRRQAAIWLDMAMNGTLKLSEVDANVLAIMKTVYKDKLIIDGDVVRIQAEAGEKDDVQTLARLRVEDPDGAVHDLFDIAAEDLHDVFAARGLGPVIDNLGHLLGLDPSIWGELGMEPGDDTGLSAAEALLKRKRRPPVQEGPVEEVVPQGPSFFDIATRDDDAHAPTAEPGTPPPVAQDIVQRWRSRLGPLAAEAVAEDRRDHAQKQAEKLREAVRQADEAYVAAVVKDGQTRHAEWREAVAVADTDVVNGRTIEKNAAGTVLQVDPTSDTAV